MLWGVAAVVGGIGFGVVGTRIGRPGWLGAGAVAGIVAILLGDAYLRYENHGVDVALLFDVLSVPVVVMLGYRSVQQLARVAVLVPPLAALGYAAAGAPNWVQQVLVS